MSATAKPGPPYYIVRRSRIHGRGVFARRSIRRGARIIEYRGERTTWELASEQPDSDPSNPQHTFIFETRPAVNFDAGASR